MILENISIFNELNIVSISFRIIMAIILGGIMGIEREQKQRPAGFRTYVIVCLGACLASITNIYICNTMGSTDPARIPSQVISGIGFLGAGTILVTKGNHISGLTTAAGLWCAACIGIAIGSGFYSGAIICTVMIIISLRTLSIVDKKFTKYNRYINIYAEYTGSDFIHELIQYCDSNEFELHELNISTNNGKMFNSVMYAIKISDYTKNQDILNEMRHFTGILILEEIKP